MNLVHLRPLAAALVGAAMVTLPGLLLRKQHDERTGDYFIEALREMNLYEPLNFNLD
jgi:hypothetical protein